MSLRQSIGLTAWLGILAASAFGGTVSGTVKDPSGAPFQGAFVQAKNSATKITHSVLSDRQGRYRIPDLAPGEYDLQVKATGFKSDPQKGVKIGTDAVSLDLPLQKGRVEWMDLSIHQVRQMLPAGKAKPMLVTTCFACHGIQTRMAPRRQDEATWFRNVDYMRDSMRYFLRDQVNDEMVKELASYLATTFGLDSAAPRSPADLPGWDQVKRGAFGDEAMQITFVDYDMPGPNRMPWSAAPDKNGNHWVPYYGRANMVGMLDPKTGKVREFRAPFPETAAIHSAVPAPDGSVWFTEQGSNRLGRIDPRTGEVGEFQAPLKDGIGTERGSRHTVRVDSEGIVWSTGSPFTRFDPKTGEFHQFAEIPTSYGVTLASDGAVWFTEFTQDGKVGKVDPKTLKVTKYALPTPNARPRRMQVDTDGTIWFAEYAAGKIGRLDPQTGAIKEYSLPGASPTPYALGIDKDRNVWYSSMDMDVIGRLNPNTGAVTEFPFPYSENGMREFHLDEQGRMWFASPPNNKVGYFVLQAAR
jgi:virginiamycin B lyase